MNVSVRISVTDMETALDMVSVGYDSMSACFANRGKDLECTLEMNARLEEEAVDFRFIRSFG